MANTGVLLLNFGEPEHTTLEAVVPFLEKIFLTNARLMGTATPEQVRARSRQLAEERAPGLIEEYEEIGGSPLHRQAREQAEGVEAELRRRGHDAVVRLAMQFTEPSIALASEQMRAEGVDRLVALPVYPLCGPSTTVAALEELSAAVRAQGWDVPVHAISGWHRHPGYLKLRAAAIRRTLEENALTLDGAATRLVFSAHGTPMKYIEEEGSRYDEYVREFCAAVARELGGVEYTIGYQNHGNRPGVRWTQPAVDRVIAEIEAERVVVDACSFMHEQSETLAELDGELREEAEARGLAFYRVPIPHAAPEFIGVMADLVESVLAGAGVLELPRSALLGLDPCACAQRAGVDACCANGQGGTERRMVTEAEFLALLDPAAAGR
jgi:protoporphyrin/coproporphyrin ferrochelatase